MNESMRETISKLDKAKKWFAEVTGVDPDLISFMGISQLELIEAYEREIEGKTV